MDYVLVYTKGDGEGKISVYSDVDYGGCLDSRKLIGGYVIFKGENVITWHTGIWNTRDLEHVTNQNLPPPYF